MNFGYTIVYVPDVPATVSFYEEAFGLARRFMAEDGTYAEMETGATTLSFAASDFIRETIPVPVQGNDPGAPPPGIEIAFTTADVPAALEKAQAAGATPVMEPQTKPWGQVVAYVRDLNGVLVEICTPMQ